MIDIIENLTSLFYDTIRYNCSEDLNNLTWEIIYMDLKDNNFTELFNTFDFMKYENETFYL